MRDIDVNIDNGYNSKVGTIYEEYNHRQPLDWLESELLNFFPNSKSALMIS